MRHILSLATLGMAALLISPPGLAQTPPPSADSAPAAPTQPGGPKLVTAAVRINGGWRASKMIGSAVYDGQNEKIGNVDDLILSAHDRVVVAVISVGGFLGIGGKLVAVPWDQLRYDPASKDAKVVMPGASKDALNGMPNFVYNGD